MRQSAPQAGQAMASGPIIHLIQGQFYVSRNPGLMLTTTLGSCVAACLCDPVAMVGGMNHFLLPEAPALQGEDALRYGAFAMELLINNLLSAGARRERLQAKLFGGGHLIDRLVDVGERNVAFAEAFLEREFIRVVGGSVRGGHARRIQYWPATGRARQLALGRVEAVIAAETGTGRPIAPKGGAVELF
jgi:chemotaxis protein CheD